MEVDQKSKSYQARRASLRARNTAQSKWNSFPNRNILFGDQPRRATRIDSSKNQTFMLIRMEKTSQLPKKNWNDFFDKLRYGIQ